MVSKRQIASSHDQYTRTLEPSAGCAGNKETPTNSRGKDPKQAKMQSTCRARLENGFFTNQRKIFSGPYTWQRCRSWVTGTDEYFLKYVFDAIPSGHSALEQHCLERSELGRNTMASGISADRLSLVRHFVHKHFLGECV